MKLLDAYLARRAATTFASIVSVLVAIIILLDLTNKIGIATRGDGSGRLLAVYYLLKVPELLVSVASPALLIAGLVVCAPMLRRGEFVALSAGGQGTRSATRALLWCAAVVGLGCAFLSDRIVPPYTARAEMIDDVLDKQVRDGKCWKVHETGSVWFVQHALTRGQEDYDLRGVAVAPASGGLLIGDRLRWDGQAWLLEGSLARFEILPDGRYRHSIPERIDLTGDLRLPYDPLGLYRELLPAHTLTGWQLLVRGGRHNRGLVYGRWAQAFGPLLALMAALPVFVRFTNKDHLIGASLRAAGLAIVPLALLGMTGVVGDAVSWDPLWVTVAALGAASLPSLWVYLRWRL